MNVMNGSAREVRELITRYPHAPQFTGCALYNDCTIYNTIPTSPIFKHREAITLIERDKIK